MATTHIGNRRGLAGPLVMTAAFAALGLVGLSMARPVAASDDSKFNVTADAREEGLVVLAIDESSPMIQDGACQGAMIRSVAGRTVRAVDELLDILSSTPGEMCKLELVPPDAAVAAAAQQQ